MTEDEIINWIDRCYNDEWYKLQMMMTTDVLESIVGSNLSLLPMMGPLIRDRLEDAINKIETRRVVWVRPKIGFMPRSPKKTKPRIVYLDIPPKPIIRAKIIPVQHFTIFARCASCGGNKWLGADIDGKEYALCYYCLPISQYGSIGARRRYVNLISRFVQAEEEKLCPPKSSSTSDIPIPA